MKKPTCICNFWMHFIQKRSDKLLFKFSSNPKTVPYNDNIACKSYHLTIKYEAMRKVLCILLFVFGSLNLYSQTTGEIKGNIVKVAALEPLENAAIAVLQNDVPIYGAYSDDKGDYLLTGIPAGKYSLRFTLQGFDTLLMENVTVIPGQTIIRNVEMLEVGRELGEVTKKAINGLVLDPGVDPTLVYIPREALYKYPGNGGTLDPVNQTPTARSRDGKFGNFGGSRQDATIFINGVKIRNGLAIIPRGGVEAVTVHVSGIPAQFGDVVGGVIEITMRNISNKYFGSVEARTSKFLDDYGHYYFSGTFGGPLINRKEKKIGINGKRKTVLGKPILGFVVSLEGAYDKDPQPGFGGWNKATDGTLQRITNDPLRLPPAGQSGTRYNAEYLTASDFEKTSARMNAASQYFNANVKLDFAPAENTFISIGGYLNANQSMIWDRNNSMFNWENNGRTQSITGSVFGRFAQYFHGKPDKNGKYKGVKEAMVSLQVDYLKGYSKTEDARHGDNFFNYGYVGKFDVHSRPTYAYGYDPKAQKSGYLFTGYQDTLVVFTPSNINPQIAGITSQMFSLYPDASGHYDQLSSISNNGGVLNGASPRTVYDMYNAPGTAFNGYQLSDNNQFRIVLSSTATVGNHNIGMGVEFEQRNDAFYNLNPQVTNQQGLWTIARQLTNSHLGTLDTANSIAVYDQFGNYNDTINYHALYVADPNRPGFGLGQTLFDYNLRNKLGLDPAGLDRINVDALDPNFLNINMFGADELLNNGNNFVIASGYDMYGNRTNSNTSLEDFFLAKDKYGNHTRPVAAFQPIYLGGYIQDKFTFKDMVFNVGLRIDRYDANQKVLKDPYSLYDTRKVSDVNDLNGNPVHHPGNAQDNWVVYVNDVNNPTEILGYRDGNTWYNSEGHTISDPTVLRNSSGRVQPYLVDPNADVRNPGPGLFNAFKDYTPQINIMPRINFYFPIGPKSMFAASYDVLTQRPTVYNGNRNLSQQNPLDYLFWDNTSYNSSGTVFNNPNLRPERTTDFSLSFVQIISDVVQIKVRAFYKEMRDMIAATKVQEAYPRSYTSWSNIDFATSKGLTAEILLKPDGGNLNLNASYTLQFADGTGSSSFSQLNLINSGSPNLRSTIPLGYDSRHTFKLFGTFDFGEPNIRPGSERPKYLGPKGKFFESIFKNLSVGISMSGNSGVPYSRQVLPTPTQLIGGASNGSLLGSLNGARLPFEFYGDLNVIKNIDLNLKKKGGKNKPVQLQLYLNIQNLFNIQNIVDVYRATGSPSDDGYLSSPNYQSQIASQVDPASYMNYYAMKAANPYNYSMPRRVKFGVMLNF
jgi:hypothetical protein